MKYLEIRRLGPIIATGVMEISPVTLFCGRQGRGKSTIVKILSTCIWLEKAISRQEVDEKYYTLYNRFRKTLCGYHQIEDFFVLIPTSSMWERLILLSTSRSVSL